MERYSWNDIEINYYISPENLIPARKIRGSSAEAPRKFRRNSAEAPRKLRGSSAEGSRKAGRPY